MKRFGQCILYGVGFVILAPFICGTALVLFWMGRPLAEETRNNLVVDEDLLSDDPGVDVDGEE